MATLNIFVSFEYDKDNDLKNSFLKQAKSNANYKIVSCSLDEKYEDVEWEKKAREAICGCDVVVVFIGEDTHNAPGVKVETNIAKCFKKHVIQVRPQKRHYKGLRGLPDPIPGKWKRINAELERINAELERINAELDKIRK